MTFNQLSAGRNVPSDINVVIEIPAHESPVKYEVDKNTGLLLVDRFMPTSMHYPCDYGYIPSTVSQDGDPVDVLVITPFKVQPGCLIRCRVLGMLNMTDESGRDSKVLALPIEKVCQQFAHLKKIEDIPQITLDCISHFFENYKSLEPEKWVKLEDWVGVDKAESEINQAIKRF